jgi:hypothetical protein
MHVTEVQGLTSAILVEFAKDDIPCFRRENAPRLFAVTGIHKSFVMIMTTLEISLQTMQPEFVADCRVA